MSNLYDPRTELNPKAPHPKDVSQQQNQERAGPHQHLTGLVQSNSEIEHVVVKHRTKIRGFHGDLLVEMELIGLARLSL